MNALLTRVMLVEALAIADAATPGPWTATEGCCVFADGINLLADCFESGAPAEAPIKAPWPQPQCRVNARFIAAARELVPLLVKECLRLHEELERAALVGAEATGSMLTWKEEAISLTEDRQKQVLRVFELEAERDALRTALNKDSDVAAMDSLNLALRNLRHLYEQMLVPGAVRDTISAARGLLGPAIERVERAVLDHGAFACECQQLREENREMRADLMKRDSIDASTDVAAFAVLNDSLSERDEQLAAVQAACDAANANAAKAESALTQALFAAKTWEAAHLSRNTDFWQATQRAEKAERERGALAATIAEALPACNNGQEVIGQALVEALKAERDEARAELASWTKQSLDYAGTANSENKKLKLLLREACAIATKAARGGNVTAADAAHIAEIAKGAT